MVDYFFEFQFGFFGFVVAVIGEDDEEGQVFGVRGDIDIQFVIVFFVVFYGYFQFIFVFGGVCFDLSFYGVGDFKGFLVFVSNVLGYQEGFCFRGGVLGVCFIQNIVNDYVVFQFVRGVYVILIGDVQSQFGFCDLFVFGDGDVKE